jgi:radical SAM superfamily enzyme YgiQ (UPF0313 family)
LIGINTFSEAYHGVAELVDNIKKSNKAPVVWGGIHATLKPYDCLGHADIVCIGEGEEAIVELAEKMEQGLPITGIKNFLYRLETGHNGKADLRPLVDLNSLHGFDYDLGSQYILENDKIRNILESDFKETFITYSSRGCPYGCSYCCNSFMLGLYKGQRYCRQRNTDLIIEELAHIKKTFPSCRHIWFNEADFLAGKSDKDIEHFSLRYKNEIDIAFSIWSNPASATGHDIEALRQLKSAGLAGLNIGTIVGNNEAQKKIYKRNAAREIYQAAAGLVHKLGLPVEYDFILCNPYETDNDIAATISLLISLPKPFKTVIYSLTYFPGTELYKKAKEDGFIVEDGAVASYTKAAYKTWLFPVNTYLNGVASLMRGTARTRFGMVFYGLLPEPILKLLIKKPVIFFFNHLPFRYFIFKLLGATIMTVYRRAKKISSILKGWRGQG